MPYGGRDLPRAAVLAAMERLPFLHTLLLQGLEGGGGIRGRHPGLRRVFVYGSQSGPVRL